MGCVMRSLVFGARGLIGSHLLSAISEREFPSLGCSYRSAQRGFAEVDVRDTLRVVELIRDYEPEVIYLACPLMEPSVRVIAETAQELGALVVAFSPDEVFGNGTHTESDPTNPETALGETHAQCEAILREVVPGLHLIVRTSTVFGSMAGHAVTQAQEMLSEGETVLAHARRHCQPTFAPDLAEAVLQLVHVGYRGTIHIAGPDRHTEFTLARLVAHVHGYDCDLVQAQLTDDNPRPTDIRLDRKRMRDLIGASAIRPVGEALRAMRVAVRPRLIAA
jgi:dTDP-4-dehydrorhamnose reductase